MKVRLSILLTVKNTLPNNAGQVGANGFRDNGPYFQNKIEKVPFESRQE